MTAGIIGATGYAGAELFRILSGHPEVEEVVVSSTSYEGKRLSNIYPNFLGSPNVKLENAGMVMASSDVVFAALPHGVGEDFASMCSSLGVPYIDLSADFRFGDDEKTYSAWYGHEYWYHDLHEASVYGLPELNRQKIREAAERGGDEGVIIANPGCYPTGASLAAFPALSRGVYGGGTIIVDSASGITGGGREPARTYHFPECFDSMTPYKVASHRHTPEISRNFSVMEGIPPSCPRPLIFTPHLAPMNRGILSTVYIPLSAEWRCGPPEPSQPRPPSKEVIKKTACIRRLYADFYRNERFVRVLPTGVFPATGRVRSSNFCDVSVHIDQNGANLIAVSAIDNMVKGAAGQAVQNMNIIFGFDEAAGLDALPAPF
ncbi:MAG: N-acetyl-gamma-glutamyl-phosphate reductase [Spirochaetaceae bacterium]|jgi:N-acetyl-gamma-glutamyl-phosphate reductase|nr:N-acetyl-gamma-glutamyl-phosphate reductase [Spirochaetaceae bacterium]